MGSAGMFAGLLGGFTGSQIEDEKRVYSEKLAQIQNNQALFHSIVSDPTMSDEARALAMKGLYVTMNQQPSQLMGKGLFPGKKGKVDPAQAIREQLSNFPIQAQAGRPAATIPPVPQATAQGALPTETPGAPSSLAPIPIMGQAPPNLPMEVPGIAPTQGLFKSPVDMAIEAGKAKRAGLEAITGRPLEEEEAARAAGIVPQMNVYEGKPEPDPSSPGKYRVPLIDRKSGDILSFRSVDNPGLSRRLFQYWNVDKTSKTGYSATITDSQGNVQSTIKDQLPPAGYLPTEHNQILAIPDPNDPTKTVYQSIPITSAKQIPGGATAKPTSQSGGIKTPPTKLSEVKAPPALDLPGRTIGGSTSKGFQKDAQAAFKDVQDANSRVQLMQTLADQAKNDPTGATDMALVNEHMNMLWGYTKGARMNQRLIEEHIHARSWPQSMQVAFDKVLAGKVLSPEQRQMFVQLARDRQSVLQQKYQEYQKGGALGIIPNGNSQNSVGQKKQNSHGDTIEWDGSKWNLVSPSK
jgi:hypothetical protein